MGTVEIIGFIAATLTTGSFVPQVIKIWQTRSVKDISLLMYVVLLTGSAMWTIYGFAQDSMPVIMANSITFLLVGAVVVMKIRFNKH
jgi:MtN3 and saliva related transmembrane protein